MGCAESKNYDQASFRRLLPQDQDYMDYCNRHDTAPGELVLRLEADAGAHYKWHNAANDAGGEDAPIKYFLFERDDNGDACSRYEERPLSEFVFRGRPTLILAAAAYTNDRILHLLDGYSTAIAVSLGRGVNNTVRMFVTVSPAQQGVQLFNRERDGANLLPGLFTATKVNGLQQCLCGGRFCSVILCHNVAVSRNTAHQPLFYPFTRDNAPDRSLIYCAPAKYFSYTASIKDDYLRLADNGFQPKFTHGDYFCLHPHTDPTTGAMLTYGFHYSVMHNHTRVSFYEYKGNEKVLKTKPYDIPGNIALHMFGFTENYFVVFANPLRLYNSLQVSILCGGAVLRALQDDFFGNLVIHIIPRPGRNPRHTKPFSINTVLQGNVYHSINCYEGSDGRSIVVDAFVSQLNAARESAQFELNHEFDVFDNHGDPYRFVLSHPDDTDEDPCKLQILATVVDSTIDFHTINNTLQGSRHHNIWILGHERNRGKNGVVESVLSRLFKIHIDDEYENFDPLNTVKYKRMCEPWAVNREHNPTNKVYMRTPLYVPPVDANAAEDAGSIFVWCYELQSENPVSILMFDAETLNHMLHISLPNVGYIPYSVHSWVHPQSVSFPNEGFLANDDAGGSAAAAASAASAAASSPGAKQRKSKTGAGDKADGSAKKKKKKQQ